MNKEIVKGSIVKYQDGFYRVSRKNTNSVNLAGVFTSYIHHKSVPINEVVEAHDEWHTEWTQSETYMSM